MRNSALLIWSLLYSIFNVGPASSLEYSLHQNDKSKTLTAILAIGLVEEGDVQRLQTFLRKLTIKKNIAVYLASPGGNLYEGMRLGLFFLK